PNTLLLILLVLGGVSMTSGTALAQVKGSVFSNDYEYREDLFDSREGQLETIWRARIYGESTALETQSAQIGGFDLFAESKYQLLENFEARVFLRGKFEAGRSQSFFGDLEPANTILIREAAVKYSPFHFFNLKAGVINQDWLDMPLLVSRQSFPGANAELSYQITEELKTGVVSQYLIPTSQTLSSRTVGAEATPTFTTQTLYLKWSERNLSSHISGTLYQYQNLPSFVAFESQKRGNSIQQINGPNNSKFAYTFNGWFTSVGFNYRMNSIFEPLAYYNIIKNNEAPETYNDGQLIGIGSKLHTNNYVYSLFYENFFAESDVVPGYYNSWAYGNTNKKGNGFEFGVQFKKKNFRIRAQYYEAKLLNTDPLQQNQQYFYLGVETGYDKI
ncbi:hypothetical protein K2X05_04370, partial [bacterium]|nr:hypothetical protein [bacterium]